MKTPCPRSLDEGGAPHRSMVDVACRADHAQHPLIQAIVQRGVMAGFRFFFDAPDHLTLPFLEAEQRAFPNAFHPLEDAPLDVVWVMLPSNESPQVQSKGSRVIVHTEVTAPPQEGDDVFFVVHDVLPPPPSSADDGLFAGWARAVQTQTLPDNLDDVGRHWCSVKDAANAAVEMLKDVQTLPPITHIAGRRYWPMEDTWKEFSQLYERTLAGQSGEFRTHHLTSTGGPEVQAVLLTDTTQQPKRPDLSMLNRLMEERTGEGWRPTVPLRQSLMLVIAQQSNQSAE